MGTAYSVDIKKPLRQLLLVLLNFWNNRADANHLSAVSFSDFSFLLGGLTCSNEVRQMQNRLIKASQVRDLCGGVSDMWLWRRLKDDPTFPRPVYIRKRRFWREANLLNWLDSRPIEAHGQKQAEG